MRTHIDTLLRRVILPRLAVNSGVYRLVDPNLSVELNDLGEYESPELRPDYTGPADRLLQVSAFGGVSPREDQIARELYGSQTGATEHPVAGWSVGAFAGAVADPAARAQSSSGGVTTWVLCELLRTGQIDGVIHMKPDGAGPALFTYQVSRTEEEIRNGAKTRYYPGELGRALEEVSDGRGKYAVVGIPSFIYEVRLLQRLDPTFKERIAFTVGLICGHQKSARYADYLAWRSGLSPSSLRDVDFRMKVSGRVANDYSSLFTVEDDDAVRQHEVRTNDIQGTDWGLGFFKSNFSDFTDDALNETADIALGDAWIPRYSADSRGTNVVLVRSSQLLELLEQGRQSGALDLEPITLEEVVGSQKALVRQSVYELPYRLRWLKRRGETVTVPRRRAPKMLSPGRKLIQRARLATSRESHIAFQNAIDAGTLAEFDKRMAPLLQAYRRAQRVERVTQRVLTAFNRLVHRSPA